MLPLRASRLNSTIVVPAVVTAVLLCGMDKIVTKVRITAREEAPAVMAGLWPLYGIGPLHFMLVE